MQVYANKRPSVSSVNCWNQIFHNKDLRVFEADNYYDYYKVVVNGSRPKYFFGETAWMDTQRFAVDNSDFSAYNIFN